MRSLRSEHRRLFARARRDAAADQEEVAAARHIEIRDPSPLPERVLNARQELAQIRKLFTEDPMVLGILDGLAEGWGPEQICEHLGLTATAYDTARRRMRRTLLREGLASCLDK